MPKPSNKIDADQHPDTHRFVIGQGYQDWSDQPLSFGKTSTNRCYSLTTIADGSRHYLWTPGKSERIAFIWLADKKLWKKPEMNGLRIAFNPEYLSSHGWTYSSPT